MTSFTITVDSAAVQAELKELSARVGNIRPVLDAIGFGIIERTQRRFETSTDPAGNPWKPNSAATLGLLTSRIAGFKSKRKKDGSLNASGQRSLANKKPLIDTGILSSKIFHKVSDNTLIVSTALATKDYAAIQQFGGKTGKNRKVTIPARPYLPIHQNGTLYPAEQSEILKSINEYLTADR